MCIGPRTEGAKRILTAFVHRGMKFYGQSLEIRYNGTDRQTPDRDASCLPLWT